MKKVLLILTVLLICVYCYAQDNFAINTEENPGNIAEKPVSVNEDADYENNADSDREIHATPVEDADMYEEGSGEREKLLPDYGMGDLGQVDLDN